MAELDSVIASTPESGAFRSKAELLLLFEQVQEAERRWNELRVTHSSHIAVLRECMREERADSVHRHARLIERLRICADGDEEGATSVSTRAMRSADAVERALAELNPYAAPAEPPVDTGEASMCQWLSVLAPPPVV